MKIILLFTIFIAIFALRVPNSLPPVFPDNFIGEYDCVDYNLNRTGYYNKPDNYTNNAPTYIPLELAFSTCG
jgi:hypothetical protein